MLNLYSVHWTDKAISMGLAPLAARLPSLQILNAPDDVLVRPNMLPRTNAISRNIQHFCCDATCAWHDSNIRLYSVRSR